MFTDSVVWLCPLKSADLKTLDYIVVGAFMKIFKTKTKEVATYWMDMFNCPLPSVSVNDRKHKFLVKVYIYRVRQNKVAP